MQCIPISNNEENYETSMSYTHAGPIKYFDDANLQLGHILKETCLSYTI